jgi:hypothetical protein
MVDLSFLKKRSTQNLKSWQNKLEKLNESTFNSGGNRDERFWHPTKNDKGEAQAIIRFLPLSKADAELDSEMFPWVKVLYHNFRGASGKYYNETCLSTIGRPDPVKEDIAPLWKGSEAEVAIARDRKSKVSYIANILVLKDPANKDNEGKVFLYKYGVKIHEKLLSAMFPEEDLAGSNPIDVTDFWSGANFHLKVKTVAGYPNYDQSTFLVPGPLLTSGDDKEIDKIWSQQHKLTDFTDPSNLKTYDELKTRYLEVIAENSNKVSKTAESVSSKPKTTNNAKEVLEELKTNSSEDDIAFLTSSDEEDNLDDTIDSLFGD